MELMESFFYTRIDELYGTNLFHEDNQAIVDRSGNLGHYHTITDSSKFPNYSITRCECTFQVDLNYENGKDIEVNSRKVLAEIVKLIKIHKFEVIETVIIQRTQNYTVRNLAREVEELGIYDFDRIVVRKPYEGGSIFFIFIGIEVAYTAVGVHRWLKQYSRMCYGAN